MTASAVHVSDLHVGRRESPGVAAALAAFVADVAPEVVIATGDLAHRGRTEQLETARAVLDSLPARVVAVPGNHDIPYSFPARFTSPWRRFEAVFGTTRPVYRSERVAVCGLNSVRPWRHQSGALGTGELGHAAKELADARPRALRVIACHHHLAGSPWRAARKRPLAHRDRALADLAAAGAELVLGGHIHQCSAVERHEFEALDGDAGKTLVVATAPGLGRPRPHRRGEAQGLNLYEWDDDTLAVVTHVWTGAGFRATARREFPRATTPTD